MKIIKQELQFEECLKQRLEFICEFAKVTPTFKDFECTTFKIIDDLYKNGIFNNNDNEIANNIYTKVTIPDENGQIKNTRKNNDTRF